MGTHKHTNKGQSEGTTSGTGAPAEKSPILGILPSMTRREIEMRLAGHNQGQQKILADKTRAAESETGPKVAAADEARHAAVVALRNRVTTDNRAIDQVYERALREAQSDRDAARAVVTKTFNESRDAVSQAFNDEVTPLNMDLKRRIDEAQIELTTACSAAIKEAEPFHAAAIKREEKAREEAKAKADAKAAEIAANPNTEAVTPTASAA